MKLTKIQFIPCFADEELNLEELANDDGLEDLAEELNEDMFNEEEEPDHQEEQTIDLDNDLGINDLEDDLDNKLELLGEEELLENQEDDLGADSSEEDSGVETNKRFDLESVLSEIDGMKAPELRKYAAKAKAEAESSVSTMEAKLQEAEERARLANEEREARVAEYNKKEEEFITNNTTTPIIPVEQTSEFQGMIKELSGEIESTVEFMDPALSKEFSSNAIGLAKEFQHIATLSGEDRADALSEFKDKIQTTYEEDYIDVLKSVKSIAKINKKAFEYRESYDLEAQSKSNEFHEKQYAEQYLSNKKLLEDYMTVTDEEVASDPFQLRTIAHKMFSGSANEAQYKDLSKKDNNYINLLISGYPPFKEDNYKGVNVEDAKKKYIRERKDFEEKKVPAAAQLMKDGVMARRILPDLIKKLNSQGGGKGNATTPTPKSSARSTPKRRSSAPTDQGTTNNLNSIMNDDEKELKTLRRELDQLGR